MKIIPSTPKGRNSKHQPKVEIIKVTSVLSFLVGYGDAKPVLVKGLPVQLETVVSILKGGELHKAAAFGAALAILQQLHGPEVYSSASEQLLDLSLIQ